jgi:hypothetical protein
MVLGRKEGRKEGKERKKERMKERKQERKGGRNGECKDGCKDGRMEGRKEEWTHLVFYLFRIQDAQDGISFKPLFASKRAIVAGGDV